MLLRRISLGHLRLRRAIVPINREESVFFGVGYYNRKPVAIFIGLKLDVFGGKNMKFDEKLEQNISYNLRIGRLQEVSITGEYNSYWDRVARELIIVVRKPDNTTIIYTVNLNTTGMFSAENIPYLLRSYGW